MLKKIKEKIKKEPDQLDLEALAKASERGEEYFSSRDKIIIAIITGVLIISIAIFGYLIYNNKLELSAESQPQKNKEGNYITISPQVVLIGTKKTTIEIKASHNLSFYQENPNKMGQGITQMQFKTNKIKVEKFIIKSEKEAQADISIDSQIEPGSYEMSIINSYPNPNRPTEEYKANFKILAKMVIRAKGEEKNGWPCMTIIVNGEKLDKIGVSSKKYREYSVYYKPKDINRDIDEVSIEFVNNKTSSEKSRYLYIDSVKFFKGTQVSSKDGSRVLYKTEFGDLIPGNNSYNWNGEKLLWNGTLVIQAQSQD